MNPFVIAAIVIVVLLILFAIISALTSDNSAAAASNGKDDLANAPGHDHSNGAENCTACKASAEAIKKKVPEKCLVLFRPKSNWKGEFGFDWLRQGDSGLVGDSDYSNFVGSYGTVYATESTAVFTKKEDRYKSLKDGYYDPFKVNWKKNPDNTIYEYFSPWIALFPKDQCSGTDNPKKCEAVLSLSIEVVGHEPEVLRLVYDKEFFKIDKEEITPKTVGKNKTEITIECIKEFAGDKEIKIIPHKEGEEELAGKLWVVRNDKANRYKANVVFVKVETKINTVAKIGSTANEKPYLEKYMCQTLTTLNFKEENLDLKTNVDFNTNCLINLDPTTMAVNTFFPANKTIHEFLEKAFDDVHTGYGDWYKVFFFDENGGYLKSTGYAGLNGCARNIPSKSVVLYNGHNTATTTHELLHAMGLQHTFDNNGEYTYKIGETENIMDYSHQPKFGPKDRIATWRWQWKKLQSILEKE